MSTPAQAEGEGYDPGPPFRYDRRRKVPAGHRVDSQGHLLSPNGQLLYQRKRGRKVVWVEGYLIRAYDAVSSLERLARRTSRILKRKP